MKEKIQKKVLIALDYSTTSQKVAEEGFIIAKAMHAQVFLVHVIEDLVTYSLTYLNMGPLQLESVMDLKDGSVQLLEKTKQLLGDDTIETVVKEGVFSDCIIETAQEFDIDCIVMGSHSKKWLENIFMGSVTTEVMRKTTIPMFIIPTGKRD